MPEHEGPRHAGPRHAGPRHAGPRHEGPEPSIDAVRRTDGFLDALADGRPVALNDAADAELAALLGSWRDEMRWPPATGLITDSDAIAALEAGRGQKGSGPGRERWNTTAAPTSPRRNRRGLSTVGAAAAAVLCIGGFGALVAGAGPGDALYGLRTMMFGAPKQVRDAQIGLAARTELNQVQNLIEQGAWDQAQDKLVAVSTQVESVVDEEQRQDLRDQFNDLSAKVVERDPEATAAPGVVYTVPPSAAELVPALAPPTSVPSAPVLSDSTTPTTTGPESTAATSSTQSSSPAAATEAGTPSTSAASTGQSQPAPTPTTSAAPTGQSQPVSTPTSAAPTGVEAPTTTPVPAMSEAPAAASVTPETAAPAPASTAVQTQAETQPSTAAVNTSEAAPAPVTTTEVPMVTSEAPPAAVTTTVPVPVPVG
ncbi:MAG: anti-sigma-D factor RsdA [Mycobacterium sp.]